MDREETTREAVELLCRLTATPRASREEQAATDLLEDWMTRRGLEPHREANNLWTVAPGYDAERQTLLLCAHVDTIRPVAGWQHPPHRATLEGDRLFGLGTNDDGASLVSLLAVFRMLRQARLGYNLLLLASAEEEVSGTDGIERALRVMPRVDVALVGEPTGMQPAVAERGLMVLDCTAYGRAGHAAREEGDNAIYHALDDIQRLRSFEFPEVSPLLGRTKVSVTMVEAGTQHNVVPDRCRFVVDVRPNELYTNEEVLQRLRDCMQSQVVARSMRLAPSRIDPAHPLVRRAVALGRTPFGSPTLSDQALLRCPSLKMGPGDSRRSHTADEFVCLSEIEESIGLYLALLDGLVL